MSSMFDDLDVSFAATCSNATLCAKQKGFFYEFADNMKALAEHDNWLQDVFGKQKGDVAKIDALMENKTLKKKLDDMEAKIGSLHRRKSSKLCAERLTEAQVLLNRGDLELALGLVNQAVILAPTPADEAMEDKRSLALALWFRSDVLMKLKKYDLALRDLKLALKKGLTVKIRAQYYWRLGGAYKETGNARGAKISYEIAMKMFQKSDAETAKLIARDIEDLKNIRPTTVPQKTEIQITGGAKENTPALSKFVKINENESLGRHAVADAKIKTGAVLLIESPYAACLLPDFFGTHCINCFKRLEAPLSCDKCSAVAFCDIECQEIALSTYHPYECVHIHLLIGSGMSILSAIALRMVTQVGLENCRSIHSEYFSSEVNPINTAILNIEGNVKNTKRQTRKERLNRNKRDENGQVILESDKQGEAGAAEAKTSNDKTSDAKICNAKASGPKTDVKTLAGRIYSLCAHSELRKPDDYLKRIIMSLFIKGCLVNTDFFDKSDPEVLKKDERIVLELLLRNLQILQFNAHEVNEIRRGSHHCFEGSEICYIGVGIYPTGALFNHDCYPSVARYFDGKNIVLRATKPLGIGEIVAENYGPHFLKKSLSARQRDLAGRYWFNCVCTACTEDWPLMTTMNVDAQPRLRCTTEGCPNSFVHNVPDVCNKCNKHVKKDALKQNLKVAKEALKKCEIGASYMAEERPADAISAFASGIDTFYSVAAPPFKKIHYAELALASCYSNYGSVYTVRRLGKGTTK